MPNAGVKYPTVARAGSSVVPSQDALLKAMKLATTVEGAEYLYKAFEACVDRAKMRDKCGPLLQELAKFVEYVRLQRDSTGQPWAGVVTIPSGFQNLQQNLAASVANMVQEKNIVFDFAVSNDSQLIRGYSSNGQAVDEQTSSSMDILFNGWLAENNMISHEGVIYQGLPNGEIMQDQQGNSVRVQPDKLREMISQPKGGFAAYVQQKQGAVQVDARQHNFPAPTEEAQQTAQAGAGGGR